MKKRSLFAAVAMLIVSAMVLTSATYAWFNVGGDAKIVATRGSVMEAKAGVRLKTDATGARWQQTLLPQNFKYSGSRSHFVQDWVATKDGNNYTYSHGDDWSDEAAYKPMSSANGSNFLMFDMGDQNKFVADTSGAQAYRDYYEFHVATVSGTANVVGTFTLDGLSSSDTCAAAARAVVFTSTDNGANWNAYTFDHDDDETTAEVIAIFTGTEETVDTIAVTGALTTDIYDDGALHTELVEGESQTVPAGVNYIMDAEDTGYAANATANKFTTVPVAQMVDASGGATVSIPNVPNTNSSRVMVKTVIWIEGQDSNCAPSLGGGSLQSSWSFSVNA